MNTSEAICQDASFGPSISSPACRGGFDFTVTFEESIMSILPSACFLLLVPLQTARVFNRAITVEPSLLRVAKLGAICLYAGLQLALLVLWSSRSFFTTPVSVASSALGLCVALALAVISPLEHRKNPRPSFFIGTYLLISLFLDAVRVRTAWLIGANDAVAAVISASLFAKLLMLILEAVDKRGILVDSYRYLSRETTSGILSRGFFWWLTPLLSDGWKRVLSASDLFSISEKLATDRVAGELQAVWETEKHRQNGLALATMRAWRFEVAKILFSRLCLVALHLSQPFLIQRVIETLEVPDGPETQNRGYGLVGAVALVYFGTAIATGFYQHLGFRLMTMYRGGLISLIYQKAMELPSADAGDSAVMTLIGTDVERICEIWHLVIEEILPGVIQIGIAVWLLERQLGAACVAPVLLVIIATATSLKAASYVTARQKVWLEAIQERINFTGHILSSMKSVKMLGLTEKFQSLIQSLRVTELEFSKRFRRLSSFNICLVNTPSIFSQFLTFAAFAIAAEVQGTKSFSVTQAVTSMSILNILMSPLSMMIYSIPQGYAALGCFRRIEDFLKSDSWGDKRIVNMELRSIKGLSDMPKTGADIELVSLSSIRKTVAFEDNDRIIVQNGTFGWRDSAPVVSNVKIRVTQDTKLTLILGPVGSGKSTLLKGLLGESLIIDGTVWVKTKEISFCDHNPWLVNGSIRDNVVGQSEFDKAWYDSVIHACALDTDLYQLIDGDATNVGSKGVSLSGGQKQRITIARALYARTPIAIFDDVLTGLDAVTQELILKRVFGLQGMLRKLGTTTILATHAVNHLNIADQVVVLDDRGHMVKSGPPDKLSLPEEYIRGISTARKPSIAGQEDGRLAPLDSKLQSQTEDMGPQQRQIGDLSVYKYYFSTLGWFSLVVFAALVASNAAFGCLQYAWLNLWSQNNDRSGDSNLGYWLGLFGAFGVFRGVSMVLAVYYMYVVIVPKSAQNLHGNVLRAAMWAPLSFLSRTDTGSLINRFSQDMNLVDMTLPAALVNFSFHLSSSLGIAALAIVAVSYCAAIIPFLCIAVYFLQRFYLRTSRQLRLLELEAKAPMYSHILESLDGMASIRAYGWTDRYTAKNQGHLDTAQRPYYLLLCIQRWLTLVLGLIVATFTTLLTILAVVLHGKIDPGFFGIALVNMADFCDTLAALVSFWTSLETSLGAISRIKTFSEDTPSEISAGETETPPPEWPSMGSVRLENWSAHYTGSPVLHNITLSVKPGEKIAICGRTGSGKSSLILSILGMVSGSSGRILIDDLDLSTIPKDITRKRVTCVTQDPFLFSGSVRLNADPLGGATDDEIVGALEKVGLWSVICRGTGNGNGNGLALSREQALEVVVDDKFLSQGQRQLFCLGRALLRKSRVLILDEHTSSVDAATESNIQTFIESEFQGCSVIMVTHKLSGVLRLDRVAVLDKGTLVEYGPPRELLRKADGAFAKLYSTQQG